MPAIEPQGYQAAISGAAVYGVPGAGTLRIAGADRNAFIQRQTTNDIHALRPDRSLVTVLTTGTARILDVWRLVMEPESESISVITLPGRGNTTLDYLRTRIFFMDKVTLSDTNTEIAQLEVLGPKAADVLRGCAIAVPDAGQVVAADAGGVAVRAIGLEGWVGRGVLLLVAAAQAEALIGTLVGAGADLLDPAAYEILRIETGLPGPERELTGEYTPLEANLDAAVSGTKGCYSGQEIIARQITYDKITKRLVGVTLESGVVVGSVVKVEGRTAGEITSAAESPRFGSIALAVLKRPHFETGTYVTVVGEDGSETQGETVSLPFGSHAR